MSYSVPAKTSGVERMTVASAAGVVTPQPLFHHAADGVLPDYFVMTRAKGTAAGHRLTRDDAIGDRAALVRELGANLARIHAIRPPQPALDFLGAPSSSPTLDALAGYRAYLDHWRNTFGDALAYVHARDQWGTSAWWSVLDLYRNMITCYFHMQGTSTELRTLVEAVADGRLHPVIDSRYPLADIVAADRRLAERKNFGKVVLTP